MSGSVVHVLVHVVRIPGLPREGRMVNPMDPVGSIHFLQMAIQVFNSSSQSINAKNYMYMYIQ